MTRLWSILLLIFIFASAGKGVVDKKEPMTPRSKSASIRIAVENPLAKKVLEKYQAINTYYAVWMMTLPDPNSAPGAVIWEIAFDRPTKRTLFLICSQPLKEEQPAQIGQLFIADGKMMHTALSNGLKESKLQKRSIPIADTNLLTYRSMREGMFLRPFDLPLIFSESHYMEVIESRIKEIITLESTESLLRFEVLPETGETTAVFGIDPNTLLIQNFHFNYHSGRSPIFTIKKAQINEPIDDALFDFEKQLSQHKLTEKSQNNL